MPEIIDVLEAEVGTKCEQIHFGTLIECGNDAICAVIYNNGKQKLVYKKHLRIELNKELDQ